MMRRKIYREENSEPGRYNEEALDYKPGIREHPPDKVAVRYSNQTGASGPKLSFVQAILPAMHLRKAAIRCVMVNF